MPQPTYGYKWVIKRGDISVKQKHSPTTGVSLRTALTFATFI